MSGYPAEENGKTRDLFLFIAKGAKHAHFTTL
jgi:hypothetical protein